MSIFSYFNRTDNGAKSRMQSSYDFLNESTWPIVSYFRELLDSWLNDFKDDKEFISKFKSKDDKQHYGALFELLIHRILLNLNLQVVKHPEMGNGKQPDFQICDTSGFENMYVECTLSGDSFNNHTSNSKTASIEEIIDSLEYFDYWIGIDIKTHSDRSLPKRVLINWVERTANLIRNQTTLFQYWNADFKSGDWSIEFTFIPKGDTKIKRTLGFTHGGVKMIDTAKPIRTALKDKVPTKYGITNEPYLICVNTSDQFVKEECCFEAMFGQRDMNKISNLKGGDGLLLKNNLPRNRGISAVITFINFDIFTLSNCKVVMWHNPYANHEISHLKLPFTEHKYTDDGKGLKRDTITKDVDIFQIIGIDRNKYLSVLTQHKDVG
jgi:hypothetical protein